MSYDDALKDYGIDKPDLRFDMKIKHLTEDLKAHGFPVFDSAELVCGIICKGIADSYSNKDINEITDWVKRPQIDAKGLVYIKYNLDGSIKSSVGKFYSDEFLQNLGKKLEVEPGDMLLILAGGYDKTLKQAGELRLEIGPTYETHQRRRIQSFLGR